MLFPDVEVPQFPFPSFFHPTRCTPLFIFRKLHPIRPSLPKSCYSTCAVVLHVQYVHVLVESSSLQSGRFTVLVAVLYPQFLSRLSFLFLLVSFLRKNKVRLQHEQPSKSTVSRCVAREASLTLIHPERITPLFFCGVCFWSMVLFTFFVL